MCCWKLMGFPFCSLLTVLLCASSDKYQLNETSADVSSSKGICADLGMQQVIIRDNKTYEEVKDYLQNVNISNDIWVGMYWDINSQVFRWSDNDARVVESTRWCNDESYRMTGPNKIKPKKPNCVVIDQTEFCFKTSDCDNGTKYYSLCQTRNCEPCPTSIATTNQHVTSEPCPTYDVTTNQQVTCKPCPTSDPTTNKQETCEPCPTYNATTNRHVTCEPCPTSDVTTNRHVTCEPCPTSNVTTNQQITCEPCPTSNVTTNQQITCEPCPTCDVTTNQQITCEPCPTCDVTTNQQITCEPCPTCDVATNQQITCEPCPTYHATTNQHVTCEPCPTCDATTNQKTSPPKTTTKAIPNQSTAAVQSFDQTAFQDSLYKVNKEETGSYRRRRTSAYDGRFSSKVIGLTGVTILVIVCCVFPVVDMMNVFTKTGKKQKRNNRK